MSGWAQVITGSFREKEGVGVRKGDVTAEVGERLTCYGGARRQGDAGGLQKLGRARKEILP